MSRKTSEVAHKHFGFVGFRVIFMISFGLTALIKKCSGEKRHKRPFEIDHLQNKTKKN